VFEREEKNRFVLDRKISLRDDKIDSEDNQIPSHLNKRLKKNEEENMTISRNGIYPKKKSEKNFKDVEKPGGKPALCSKRFLTVIFSFPFCEKSDPKREESEMRVSRPSCPRWYKIIVVVVVARTFVKEAVSH